ncbi:MAG: hypothetical protein GX768_06765 [Chloroflexi bacterium]|jgi:predicted ArsR family transcriptional regulator|nr:hypothetical protein [Chloroflexota bacterium]
MKNIRELLLKTLAVTRLATISSLAAQLEINPITVRSHLQTMELEGLIKSSERRHGVGRPHVVYQLTNAGQEEVASKYRFLAESLIVSIKQHLGSEGLVDTLETIGQEMARAQNLESNPNLSEWMDSFCDLMAEQGYQVDWEMKDNRVYIHSASCPYHHLKQTYPEICSLDRSLFSHLLATDLRFENALSAKGSACIYSYEVIND